MTTLLFISGLPGSGKTTVAVRLQAELAAAGVPTKRIEVSDAVRAWMGDAAVMRSPLQSDELITALASQIVLDAFNIISGAREAYLLNNATYTQFLKVDAMQQCNILITATQATRHARYAQRLVESMTQRSINNIFMAAEERAHALGFAAVESRCHVVFRTDSCSVECTVSEILQYLKNRRIISV